MGHSYAWARLAATRSVRVSVGGKPAGRSWAVVMGCANRGQSLVGCQGVFHRRRSHPPVTSLLQLRLTPSVCLMGAGRSDSF